MPAEKKWKRRTTLSGTTWHKGIYYIRKWGCGYDLFCNGKLLKLFEHLYMAKDYADGLESRLEY